MNQIAEDIRGTRGVIAKAGWCQGDLQDSHGRFCLMGAWQYSLCEGYGQWDRARERHLQKFIEAAIAQELGLTIDQLRQESEDAPGQLVPVAYYNDFKLSTKQEVLDFLDKQAIRAEEMV